MNIFTLNKEAKMSELNLASNNENPSIETLKELYSHQNRECWMCKKYAEKLEAGKELDSSELFHFTNCVMSWEEINHDNQAAPALEQTLEKAA